MGEGWRSRQRGMKHPEDEGYRQPLAFIGIGSSSEQEMQQILIEDKVGQSPSKKHFTTNKLQLAKSGTHAARVYHLR